MSSIPEKEKFRYLVNYERGINKDFYSTRFDFGVGWKIPKKAWALDFEIDTYAEKNSLYPDVDSFGVGIMVVGVGLTFSYNK